MGSRVNFFSKKVLAVTVVSLFILPSFVFAVLDSVQMTPAMGWNSWNFYGCNINQATILAQAVAMKTTSTTANWEGKLISMQDVGYRFVNLDDCWEGSRTNGVLNFNASLWPKGFNWLCDTIRSFGLKPGLYTSAGTATCAGRPAQYGYDTSDALQYAKWGFQYLKEDWCNVPGSTVGGVANLSAAGATRLYKLSYGALRWAADSAAKAGRWAAYTNPTSPRWFTFSLCNWGSYSSWTYGAQCGHSARMSGDISANWTQVVNIINQCTSNNVVTYNQPGFFNDPDMLEVGNGLTQNQNQAHFDLWCQMQSPLLTGNNLSTMTAAVFNVLTNREVIAVNQDSLNWGGRRVKAVTTNLEEWYKRCFTRTTAGVRVTDSTLIKKSVILFNKGSSAASYSISRKDPLELGTGAFIVRDLWQHKDIDTLLASDTALTSISVPATATVHLLFTPMYLTSVPAEQIKKVSDVQISSLIKARRSADGFEIYVPFSGKVSLFDVQGKQIASFAAGTGAHWYKVSGNFAARGTYILRATMQDRMVTKTLIMAR